MPEMVEVYKKACTFVLRIGDPNETLRRLAIFFEERHIEIDNLQMHRSWNHVATVIVLCVIEKDRIWRTVQLLGQIPGIIEVQKMEAK